jgi:hypothetical protein
VKTCPVCEKPYDPEKLSAEFGGGKYQMELCGRCMLYAPIHRIDAVYQAWRKSHRVSHRKAAAGHRKDTPQ